ncbi:MAG: hypothetical protein GC168_16615 [Candidatus Hydrogenedens sp.]|nr:hypothetical protein [Candidatus Hydrogenedens sp.]
MMKRLLGFLLAALVLACGPGRADDGGFVTSAYDPSKLSEADLKMTEAIATALEGLEVEGWKHTGVERYTPEGMYDKINGRSELYLSYGTSGLAFCRMVGGAGEIEIFLYDMTEPVQAYGVFGVERFEEGEPLEIGEAAYRSRGDVFFRKGRFYATFVASDDTPELHAAEESIGKALAARLDSETGELWGVKVFTAPQFDAGSIKYFNADAMSLEFMPQTYTAESTGEFNGATITYFVRMPADEAAIRETLDRYRAYFGQYGESTSEFEDDGHSFLLCHLGGGYYDAVFATPRYVGGVTAVKGEDAAREAVVSFSDWVRN